ncbi:hypothetical protein DPMN_125268 [Dreissena polymorpha]|uniref:Uncharacterized protein n=1 Tax=Dreissena polymorpha TaxID=45954 RepID=A0A9D4GXV7_DREPO|nr:hypothetical protein DPMN_125268 [Dreissena polymorpha]
MIRWFYGTRGRNRKLCAGSISGDISQQLYESRHLQFYERQVSERIPPSNTKLFPLLNAGSPEQIDVQQRLQRDIYWGQSRELQYNTLHSSRDTRRTGEN